jgi:hypothetical protein
MRDEDKSTLFLSASLAALVLGWLTKTWAEQGLIFTSLCR